MHSTHQRHSMAYSAPHHTAPGHVALFAITHSTDKNRAPGGGMILTVCAMEKLLERRRCGCRDTSNPHGGALTARALGGIRRLRVCISVNLHVPSSSEIVRSRPAPKMCVAHLPLFPASRAGLAMRLASLVLLLGAAETGDQATPRCSTYTRTLPMAVIFPGSDLWEPTEA